jgi:hypothetical protein
MSLLALFFHSFFSLSLLSLSCWAQTFDYLSCPGVGGAMLESGMTVIWTAIVGVEDEYVSRIPFVAGPSLGSSSSGYFLLGSLICHEPINIMKHTSMALDNWKLNLVAL